MDKKTFITKEYPDKSEEIVVNKITVNYSQSNEMETETEDNLELTIDHQGAGFYFVMKTDRWAFNDIDELVQLLKDFKKKSNI